ncbi:MAG: heat-inducible transcriptional repressor HrcA [Acidobacteriota bacterium]
MAKQQHSEDLNERACDVLQVLIREYVRDGKPVGSRRLAKIHGEGLSPATIRNVMADLEEMGFVTQPHTSAGRVPTVKGYRFYVDSLLETKRLASQEVDRIKRSLEQETDPGELMSKTSQILSALSSNVGFVLAPPISLAAMKHIEFFRISRQRILVILVTGTGLVQHRLIHLDQDLTQGELDQAGRYLVTHFEDKALLEIRDELLTLMLEEKSLYDRMLKNVILLGSASLMKSEDDQESEVYLGGTSRIIQKPELADINRMIALFQTFEEKSRLVKIITECLKSNPSGPTVTIGLEKHIPEMGDWALISSPYVYQQRMLGGLGVLGPSRMEYEKAISLVDYVAKLFGKLLSAN